jgi:hypothetical protein
VVLVSAGDREAHALALRFHECQPVRAYVPHTRTLVCSFKMHLQQGCACAVAPLHTGLEQLPLLVCLCIDNDSPLSF